MSADARAAIRDLALRHRPRGWEALPWVAGLAAFFLFPTNLAFGTQLLVTILFALSLDLVLGYAGIITLGHAAFFGAGAYTVGMLAMHLGWTEPLTGLLAAALVAGLVGLLSGWVLLRTHGLTLLMLTLCTMVLLEQAANMFSGLTGGFDGMPGLAFKPILGLFEFDVLYFRSQYFYALAVLFLGFLLVRALVYSSFGRSLTGIRENLLRMHAVGAPVRSRQVVVYAISAALAGVLTAFHERIASPEVLGWPISGDAVLYATLGGSGTLLGPLLGAIIVIVAREVLSDVFRSWLILIGATYIALVFFLPSGLYPLLFRARERAAAPAAVEKPAA